MIRLTNSISFSHITHCLKLDLYSTKMVFPHTSSIYLGIHFIFNLRGFLEEKYLDKGSTYIRILPSFFDTYTHSNDSIYKDFINVNSNLTSETIQEIKLKN